LIGDRDRAQCPDLEWTVDDWTSLPGLNPAPYQWIIKFTAFAGSFQDGGIGEDNCPNTGLGIFEFECWKLSESDIQFPNNRTRPVGQLQLTGYVFVCWWCV
jgi:hypothetical protein